MSGRTIGRLWRDALRADHPEPAYLHRVEGEWREVGWAEAGERVDLIANGLLAWGVGKGDVFGILGRTTLEWALFDFALALVGGVTAPIYATSSAKDAGYVLSHSGALGVLAEDAAQRAKVDEERAQIPALRHVLTFADLDDLAEEGRAYRAAHPDALAAAEAAVGEDDLYTFIYTSGTTGPPKGCMLLHRNYYEMVSVVQHLERFLQPGDTCLLYLPLAHNFGRLVHLAGPFSGFTVAFEPDPYAVARTLGEIRPTVLPSVPRIFEKIHTAVVSAFDEATGPKGRLIAWALDVGRQVGALRREGQPIPRSLAVRHRIADRLVYAKVKERLGGRLRLPISGGAPLAREVAELFDALDIRIMEAYGLTECTSGATVNTPNAYRYGTVGKALPGFELRLDEDGELLLRSETVFAGYHREPEATAAVLDADGWLRTGDIAAIDDQGFVTITDRKKDIIVTAGGKNIAPQNIENDLKTSRWISQALVVGDRRPYATALVTLDPVEIDRWAEDNGVEPDMTVLAHDPRVRALVQEAVDAANRHRTRFEQVKRFTILPRDFTLDDGEVTPTLKLRRRVCIEHFSGEIDRLYAAPDDPAAASPA